MRASHSCLFRFFSKQGIKHTTLNCHEVAPSPFIKVEGKGSFLTCPPFNAKSLAKEIWQGFYLK
jgi:hypothetical protein